MLLDDVGQVMGGVAGASPTWGASVSIAPIVVVTASLPFESVLAATRSSAVTSNIPSSNLPDSSDLGASLRCGDHLPTYELGYRPTGQHLGFSSSSLVSHT